MRKELRPHLAPVFAGLLALLLLGFAAAPGPATPPLGLAPPSGVERAAPADPGAATQNTGPIARAWGWLVVQQQRFNRELTVAVRNLKTGDFTSSAAILALIAFTYGVLHAAGPGHGKAVISAYVLANERTMRRGVMLSFLAALIQALSAIIIVGILAVILRATSLKMRTTEAWIETVSWAFIAAVGAWLLYRQIKPLAAARLHSAGAQVADAHEQHGHNRRHHHHNHAHDETCDCGHAHIPAPRDLDRARSWREAAALALAVGIRPCTGAILVLVFALSQGLLWAGVFATFAMALGTAITVSALAALAVGSRELATKMAGSQGVWASRVQTTAGLAGAALVFTLGITFFIASLRGPSPF